MSKKTLSALFVFSALGLVAAFPALRGEAQAAVCSLNPPSGASVIWSQGGGNVSSINKGEDATETWSVSGATAASGECTGGGTRPDGTKVVTRSSVPKGGLSLGPQSFKFTGIQEDLTCTVYGYVDSDDTPDCEYSATVRVNQTPTPTAPPTGGGVGSPGPRCYFYNPPQDTYGNTQRANYTSTINPDVCAAGMTNCDLAWKSVMGTAEPPDYASGDLSSSDGYSATLSTLSSINFTTAAALSGAYKLSNYQPATYTLNVSKNGASVASCSVKVVNEPAPPPPPPAYNPSTGFFPGGSYAIKIGGEDTTARFNYAPTLPNITVSEYATLPNPYGTSVNYGLKLYAGQFFKNIYFGIASYAVPYGDGRWDISDPMNPKGPDFIPVGQAQGRGRGPLFDGAWGHEMFTNDNSSVAEAPDGSARMHMVFGSLQVGNRVQSPLVVLGWDGESLGYFGQEVDNKFLDLAVNMRNGSGDFLDGRANAVMDYTSEGNFFLYYVDKTSIPVLDVTSLSGSAAEPFLPQSGSIGWSGARELQIIRDSAAGKHYLIANTGERTKPTVKIGELSPGSGKVVSAKNQSIAFGTSFLSGETCPAGCPTVFGPGSNIKSFNVGSKTYVLMTDDFKYNAGTFGSAGKGDLILGLYAFNPDDLSLNKVSAVTVKGITIMAFYNYQVAADVNGGAYPVLAIIRAADSPHVAFYGLKPAFSNSAVTLDNPDFAIPNTPAPKPVKPGDLVLNLYPFQTFLVNESGGVKMYFYRPAYKHVGERTFFDNPFEVTAGVCAENQGGGVTYYGCRGDASLRVDQFDVDSIASGATGGTSPPTGGGPTPPGGTSTSTAPIPGGGDCSKYEDAESQFLCKQVNELIKTLNELKSLEKELCDISPSTYFCAK